MQIAGYLKTSLIEWPGKISSVIFTPGCNFRCPFCHNADLVEPGKKLPFLKEEEVLADLKNRVKWIDAVVLSIGSKEPVPVLKNEFLTHPKIENLWDFNKRFFLEKRGVTLVESQPLKNINCLTHSGFQPAKEIVRHKVKELYKIICGPGNYKIEVTGSHSVFVVNSKGFFPKRVDELTKEDWLLSAKKIPLVKPNISKISILDYVNFREINRGIREEKIAYWEKITSQIGRITISELSRKSGHQRKTIRNYYHLSQNGYKNLLDEWVIDDNSIRNKTSKTKIPVTLTLDSDLGEFLGYAVAEGCVRYKQGSHLINGYVFTLGNEPKLARRILFLYRKIFGVKNGTIVKSINDKKNFQYSVMVGGRVVGELISVFVGRGFANKKIPDIIFNALSDIQKAFIKGLIEGDGCERIRTGKSQHEYSLKTASQKLAQDLILLARILDCFCWIERDKEYFKVVFSQNDLAKVIGEKKLSLKYSFRTRIEGIPRQLLGYSLRGQKRISREELLKWFDLKNYKRKAAAVKFGLVDKSGNFTQKLKNIKFLYDLTENWEIKEIRKIEKINLKEEEYVYDLIVEKNHSFVAGTGLLLVHNTGGEPTLQEDLPDFLDKVGDLGFLRMIHTNGTNPKMLEKLLAPRSSPNGERSGVNYIAMDVKGDFENYEKYTNVKCPDFTKVSSGKQMSDVKSSIEVIARGGVDCEFRTTVVPTLHTLENLKSLAKELEEMFRDLKLEIRNCRWFLQQFRPLNTFDKSYLKVEPFSEEEMKNFRQELQKIIPNTFLRGV